MTEGRSTGEREPARAPSRGAFAAELELEPRKSATRAGLAVYLFLSIAIVADPGREPLIDVALALPDPRCVCVCGRRPTDGARRVTKQWGPSGATARRSGLTRM